MERLRPRVAQGASPTPLNLAHILPCRAFPGPAPWLVVTRSESPGEASNSGPGGCMRPRLSEQRLPRVEAGCWCTHRGECRHSTARVCAQGPCEASDPRCAVVAPCTLFLGALTFQPCRVAQEPTSWGLAHHGGQLHSPNLTRKEHGPESPIPTALSRR